MSPDNEIFDQIRLFLPKYLSAEETRELFSALAKFPHNQAFYLLRSQFPDDCLQGDGWKGFVAIEFFSGTRKGISAMILSNSCDIAQENARDFPINILFAPLIRLQAYIDRLVSLGKSISEIDTIVANIKSQRVSSIFYLPPCTGGIDDSIVLLDDIHTQPLKNFLQNQPTRLFTLNQYGFYILLIKLSIHFSRFREGVHRFDPVSN